MITPGKITVNKTKNTLAIVWSDEERLEIPIGALRRYCPCAHCQGARTEESRHFIPIFGKEQTTISSITPVGQYAIQIAWEDGHFTGLYEFKLLRQIASLIEGEIV